MSKLDETLRREAEFHDALAATLDARQMPPRELEPIEVALLDQAGDLAGLDVLDLGCGTGDLTLELMGRGARVTALDISAGMVDVARRRTQAYAPDGRVARVFVGNAEDTGLPAAAFDMIVGKWILHHLDVGRVAAELRRLLRPGGRAVFVENQAINPVLRVLRRHVAGRFGIPLLGTRDEHPFTEAEFAALRREFPAMRVSYPDFFFFRIFNRQVLRMRWEPVTRAVRRIDDEVYARAPRLRRQSYHVIVDLPT